MFNNLNCFLKIKGSDNINLSVFPLADDELNIYAFDVSMQQYCVIKTATENTNTERNEIFCFEHVDVVSFDCLHKQKPLYSALGTVRHVKEKSYISYISNEVDQYISETSSNFEINLNDYYTKPKYITITDEIHEYYKTHVTGFYLACKYGHLDILNILYLIVPHNVYNNVYNNNNLYKNPLAIAVTNSHINVTDFLLTIDHFKLQLNNQYPKFNPLHVAAHYNMIKMAKLLIHHGANPCIAFGNIYVLVKMLLRFASSNYSMPFSNKLSVLLEMFCANNIDYFNIPTLVMSSIKHAIMMEWEDGYKMLINLFPSVCNIENFYDIVAFTEHHIDIYIREHICTIFYESLHDITNLHKEEIILHCIDNGFNTLQLYILKSIIKNNDKLSNHFKYMLFDRYHTYLIHNRYCIAYACENIIFNAFPWNTENTNPFFVDGNRNQITSRNSIYRFMIWFARIKSEVENASTNDNYHSRDFDANLIVHNIKLFLEMIVSNVSISKEKIIESIDLIAKQYKSSRIHLSAKNPLTMFMSFRQQFWLELADFTLSYTLHLIENDVSFTKKCNTYDPHINMLILGITSKNNNEIDLFTSIYPTKHLHNVHALNNTTQCTSKYAYPIELTSHTECNIRKAKRKKNVGLLRNQSWNADTCESPKTFVITKNSNTSKHEIQHCTKLHINSKSAFHFYKK